MQCHLSGFICSCLRLFYFVLCCLALTRLSFGVCSVIFQLSDGYWNVVALLIFLTRYVVENLLYTHIIFTFLKRHVLMFSRDLPSGRGIRCFYSTYASSSGFAVERLPTEDAWRPASACLANVFLRGSLTSGAECALVTFHSLLHTLTSVWTEYESVQLNHP